MLRGREVLRSEMGKEECMRWLKGRSSCLGAGTYDQIAVVE